MPRKCFINGTLVEVCFRTQQGLPLAANSFIRLMLESVLTRAATNHPVRVSHFVVMANHIHLLLVVENPSEVSRFVEYIKKETSHALNRLMGTTGINLWKRRYDSPIILDPRKAIERIIYFYTNPQKAHLVDSIEQYPNLSSWLYFLKGGGEIESYRLPRIAYPEVSKGKLSLEQQLSVKRHIEKHRGQLQRLYVEPDCWMECFEELDGCIPSELNQQIIDGVREKEKEYIKAREEKGFEALGVEALRMQEIREPYRTKTWGKRMICLATEILRRVNFIGWFSKAANEAYGCFQQMKRGEKEVNFPPGFYTPGGALWSNVSPLLRRDLMLV